MLYSSAGDFILYLSLSNSQSVLLRKYAMSKIKGIELQTVVIKALLYHMKS